MIDAAGGGARRERKTDSAVSVAVDNPGAIPTGYSHSDAGSANDDFYFRSYHLSCVAGLSTFPVSKTNLNQLRENLLKKGRSR
jgi:hypothetical protein